MAPLRRGLLLVGLVLIAVGASLAGIGTSAYYSRGDVIQAMCSIGGYQGDMERLIASDVPTCQTSCGFYVQAKVGKTTYLVNNFMPEYRASTQNPSGFAAVHEVFSCCPTSANDCCAFQEGSSGLFCDSWGGLNQECPSGPWPCYFPNLEEYRASGRLPGSVLEIGEGGGATLKPVYIGMGLVAAGLIAISCMWPSKWTYPCRKAAWALFHSRLYWRLARRLPPKYRAGWVQLQLEDEAARKIQGFYRRLMVRQKIYNTIREHLARCDKARAFEAKVADWTKDKMHGPFSSKLAPSKFFYDTGNGATFRRVVHSRVVSDPGARLERLEVALNKETTWLANCLQEGGKDRWGRETPAYIAEDLPRAFADVYGLRRGHRLLKVGRLEFPQFSNQQMLAAVRNLRRPTVLLFEGEPADDMDPIVRSKDGLAILLPPTLRQDPRRTRPAVKDGVRGSPQHQEEFLGTSSHQLLAEDVPASTASSARRSRSSKASEDAADQQLRRLEEGVAVLAAPHEEERVQIGHLPGAVGEDSDDSTTTRPAPLSLPSSLPGTRPNSRSWTHSANHVLEAEDAGTPTSSASSSVLRHVRRQASAQSTESGWDLKRGSKRRAASHGGGCASPPRSPAGATDRRRRPSRPALRELGWAPHGEATVSPPGSPSGARRLSPARRRRKGAMSRSNSGASLKGSSPTPKGDSAAVELPPVILTEPPPAVK